MLALLCVVQCTALLGIVYVLCDLSGPFGTLLVVLVVASLAGTALGLLISAVSPTTEAAIAFLPVVLLPFILLGGGIKPVHEMPATAQWIAAITPTRWAYEANLLAGGRSAGQSTFTNELEQKLLDCQNAVRRVPGPAGARGRATPPAASAPRRRARTETDVAAAAFPVDNGRTSARALVSDSRDVLRRRSRCWSSRRWG